MKKGLLLAFGVTATLGLVAQTQQGAVAKKMNLSLEQTKRVDAESPSFYSSANATMRSGANPTVQIAGTHISSSRNGLTLLVSQSNCMTANQTLGVAMFTHRISADWSPAGVNSGYIQNTWTTDNGTTFDSCYTDNDGVSLFRYPSGAILNGTGNTAVANAWMAIVGPWTNGSSWEGYYASGGPMTSGMGHTGNAVASNNNYSFPRIELASYNDSTLWVSGGMYADDDGTTVAAQGYSGTGLIKGSWDGSSITWTTSTITPAFHQDLSGANDCYTMSHVTFSPDGQTGYVVFFGVQASASTPETRTFQPIVYNTTDGGATWSAAWAPYDYSTAFAEAPIVLTASDGSVKPWFSMSNGSDVAVDNNGNLHIVCAVEWGSSDDDDSLGYAWGRNDFVHYIWDIHTTGSNTWEATLIDSLLTDATTTISPFNDGTNPYDLDARIQMSSSPSRDHMFYFWADSDPIASGGENAFPNLYGVGIDWTAGTRTARKQFTNTDDAYWHYNSNNALISGSTYTIPSSNSIDRDGTHNLNLSAVDHYYLSNVTFDESEFSQAIGINEAVASFGTVATYPNPVNEALNVNITLNNNENVVVSMFNALGQVVITETRNMTAGSNTIQLNTANLEAGVYFLSVTAGSATSTSKVVVE